MSGIFGFTYRNADPQILSDAMGGLEYWTRKYGRHAHAQQDIDHGGIGCHIQHFTDRFSYGGPILELNGCPAVVDALLFNRDEITAVLGLDAACGLSDEELLLDLIKVKGYEALAQVNGDFAGAVYNASEKEWVLFRDHLGVRPLYYYLDNNIFAFSTDQRGLAALPGADLSINETILYHLFLKSKRLSLTETEFARINCIMPGCITRVRESGSGFAKTEHIYWKTRQKKIRYRTVEEYRNELYRLITDSIHRRCDAVDGLIGGELSGGLDSSVIAILINRYGRDSLFFSWSRPPEEFPLMEGTDERKVVLAVCEQENVCCRFNSREDKIAHYNKLEYVHPPYVTTYPMGIGSNYLRSQGAKVVFTGHTGDEGVSHRGRPFELIWHKEFLPYFKIYWNNLQGKPFRILRGIRAGIKDALLYYKNLKQQPEESWFFPSLLNPDFCRKMRQQYEDPQFSFQFDPNAYVNQGGSRARFDIAAYHGAFNDTQYLFPYADYRVLDYALSIPRRLYLNKTQNRVLFRETFADIMPKELSEVHHKYTATLANRKRNADYEESFYDNLHRIYRDLDYEKWKDILNFEEIAAITPSESRKESAYITLHLSFLVRCIRIQRMQTDSKQWREMDERDKKTV